MKYTLMVSHDAGSTYFPDAGADTPQELEPRMAELDQEGWRWYLEGDDDFNYVCARHKEITKFMQVLRGDCAAMED